jgi:hypothetical protein
MHIFNAKMCFLYAFAIFKLTFKAQKLFMPTSTNRKGLLF